TLDPGHYVVVTGGSWKQAPTDVTILVTPAAEWPKNSKPPPDTPATASSCIPAPDAPRLELTSGSTPATEPEPATTIDPLVVVHTPPDRLRYAHVVLATSCFGAMAKIGEGCPVAAASIASAATCIDTEDTLVPVPTAHLTDQAPSAKSRVGTAPP